MAECVLATPRSFDILLGKFRWESREVLDWDDLRFFLAVARHKTLAAAAKHLSVTQSTVGRRLTSLQKEMGVRLLDRTTDGYVPTQAGQSILAHIERVEAETLAVERAVTGLDTRLDGLVRVAASQLLTSHVLAPMVEKGRHYLDAAKV